MEMEHQEEGRSSGPGFDVRQYVVRLLKSYPLFIVAIALCGMGAWLYLRYTLPLYQVTTYIQVEQPGEAENMLGGSPFSTPGMNVVRGKDFFDPNREIFKLQSAALIGEVVDSLDLDVVVTTKGKFRKTPVIADSLPFVVTVARHVRDRAGAEYEIRPAGSGYSVIAGGRRMEGMFGSDLMLDEDTIRLDWKDSTRPVAFHPYFLRLLSRSAAIGKYASRLSVSTVAKGGAGMLQLSARDEIPGRAKRFIDVLIYRYDIGNLDYKNKALRSEMQFLDSRLASVNQELEAQENYVRDFKANNQINDVSTSANQLLASLNNIDTKKTENAYKQDLLDLVESGLKTEEGKEERINAPGIQDADLMNLITRYNDLVFRKNNVLSQGTSMDPRLPALNSQLAATKVSIANRINSSRQEVRTNDVFLQSQEKNTSGRFRGLPEKEKNYIQVSRLLNIKQALYVFLLQRKEDKNIEFASSGIRGSRIIDSKINGNAKSPDPLTVYGIAFAMALLVPALIILARLLLNRRIDSWKDVQVSTSVPVSGEIAYDRGGQGGLLAGDKRQPLAEQFRTLRTNIAWLAQGMACKTFLVTSGISGEGKSFVSLNFADSLSIGRRKVALLEFDLRSPKLADRIGADGNRGLADFLSGEAGLEEIIFPVESNGNLFFVSSGSYLPVDPGELILSERMQTLFEHLKSHFDFVVMDTPPIEAVSDALVLGRWADVSLFVIRHKYSFRGSLDLINQLKEEGKLPNPTLIINAIRPGHGFRRHHGYGYGYGYVQKQGYPGPTTTASND